MIIKEIKKLQKLCENKGIKISLAESCTGGLISSSLTSIAGSSNFFDSGIVSYSNKAKIELLGVDKKLISKYGAVSEEVALSMSKNLYRITKSNICVSVTGIAGPTGGTKQKPVGTVYFSIYHDFESKINIINYKKFFKFKSRNTIQKKCNDFVIKNLIKLID